ncbi:hypothetical protein ACUHMQ_12865 [Chitinimonas sp. PSY-7]|uniref:hypothetical protein n=1 Tax=Chitinimonas sp. PSY-7 TaxID=3459088 RepID=UPI0040400A39
MSSLKTARDIRLFHHHDDPGLPMASLADAVAAMPLSLGARVTINDRLVVTVQGHSWRDLEMPIAFIGHTTETRLALGYRDAREAFQQRLTQIHRKHCRALDVLVLRYRLHWLDAVAEEHEKQAGQHHY